MVLSKLRNILRPSSKREFKIVKAPPEPIAVTSLDPASFSQKVGYLRQTLNTFIEESEAEFVSLIGCLNKLSRMSRETTRALETSIVMCTAGASGTVENQQLKQTFETLQPLVESTRRDTESFCEVAESIEQLSRKQEALKDTLSSLSFVGLYYTLESVRLPAEQQSNFANIRTEMDLLRKSVVTIADEQQQGLLQVRDDFSRCMAETRNSQERLREQLARRRQYLERQFEDALRVPPATQELQSKLSIELAKITPTLSSLTSTLQGHDAIRQRLMHVIDALEEMAEAGSTHHQAPGLALFMGQASTVQRGQVERIHQTLGQLISDIRQGFEQLSASVANLAALAIGSETYDSMPSAGTSRDAITKEILGLCKLIGDSLRLNEQLKQSSSPVESLAGKGSTLISEVALVIRRTALNAQIQAAHSGDVGGLDALGQQARLIADQSISHSTAISEHLSTLINRANDFQARLSAANAEHKNQQDNLNGCIETLTATLEKARKGMMQTFRDLRSTSANLQEETGAQLRSLHFLDKGVRLIDEVVAVLEYCGKAESFSPNSELDHNLAGVLAGMRSRYTMEQERLVHDQLSHAASESAEDIFFEADSTTAASLSLEDDNLELF